MVETAEYMVIGKKDEFEIRRYPKMLVATVRSGADSRFSQLFRYISGENKSKTKISMTSPVITSEEIPMTAPVISSGETMSFVVPSKYTIETVPTPSDSRVIIEESPERFIATVRFRGFAWKDEVEKQKKKLYAWLEAENISATSAPFLMQYNPPFLPGFMRRNEIGIEIEYEG